MKRTWRVWGTRCVVLAALLFPTCGGGGSGGSSLSPEAQTAIDDAGNATKTFNLALGSSGIALLRARMSTGFPEVDTLIAGGSATAESMLSAFSGSPSFSNDLKLTIFAYALERMGDTGSVSTLAEFLGNNINGDLYFSPQFVAAALQALTGQTVSNDTMFFTLDELRLLARSSSANLSPSLQKATATAASCTRQYKVVDSSGNPITYIDSNGQTRNVVVSGREFYDATIPSDTALNFTTAVAAGGGTYVNDDPVFPGSPSKQFNCAGYAFRELNGGARWTLTPDSIYDAFIRSGLLVEVSESSALAGDKVFYFGSGASLPGHVAEVYNVQSGILSNTITVRNADGQSGLWSALANASYFTGTWQQTAKYPTRKFYRWASGSAPSVIADTSVASDSAACSAASGGSFSATIAITGYTISFSPTTSIASNQGTYTGSTSVTGLPSILAYEGSGVGADLITITFDKRQVSGAGSYSLGTLNGVFESYAGSAVLAYTGPTVTDADTGDQVAFESTGGSITLTSYGTTVGDHLTGTYLANISGTRVTNSQGSTSTLTGTVNGSFDLQIQ